MFKERVIIINEDTIAEALQWLSNWNHSSISLANPTATIEATLKALQDINVKFQNFEFNIIFKINFTG